MAARKDLDLLSRYKLPFDEYARLAACAQSLMEVMPAQGSLSVLDAGGSNGAIRMFLPEYEVVTLQEATVSGDIYAIDPGSFDAVVISDGIERVEPKRRGVFVTQMTRVCRQACVLNFQLPSSATAQKLVVAISGDRLVAEQLKHGLPYSATIQRFLEDVGFECRSRQHTSIALWATYKVLLCSDSKNAESISRYLMEDYDGKGASDPLYETLSGVRRRR